MNKKQKSIDEMKQYIDDMLADPRCDALLRLQLLNAKYCINNAQKVVSMVKKTLSRGSK